MSRFAKPNCRLFVIVAVGVFTFAATAARAQSIEELNSRLSDLEPKVNAALSNESQAPEVVSELDRAEADFAKVASNPKVDKAALVPAYQRLESMIERLYSTYKKKKDDCIAQIDQGGQCDYDAPEQIALRAVYPLSWLRFQGATSIYSSDAERSKKVLNEAIDGFTESTLVLPDPNLVRENLLGRAFCERELGKFDKAEYDKAIADFKQIMADGTGTAQYKAAQQGLATTYAAMGNAAEAQKLSGGLGTGGGAQMFQLQNTYAAMYATRDAAKKQQYQNQIVEVIRAKENDKEGWAVGVGAVAKFSHDPIGELGSSSDPFQKHLLANVLLSKKDQTGAAKYFLEAARSGKYPRDYKYAADIYFNQHNMGQVEQILADMSKQSGNPDAQWAEYMRYKLPRGQWESSGMKNQQLEDQWVNAAEDYLKKYPKGEFSNEARFRLAERLQRQQKYADAAADYAQVSGGEYGFAAKFNAAECNYLQLVAAGAKESKDKNAPKVNTDELRKNTITLLNETIKMAPEAEREAGGAQKKFVHDTKGRAIYMLAGLLQQQQNKADAQQIASLLEGYESSYPAMSEKFHDVFEWRIQALNTLGKYDDIERDLHAFLERNGTNTQNSDFIKELGLDFWKDGQLKLAAGDKNAYVSDAKLTALAYGYFENMVSAGKMQVKNLTGTLSILGQAYMVLGQEPKAETIFSQVVKADAASPDANAGLARIAQSKKNYKDAVTLWTNVENTAAESDNLWYEAKYHIAEIYAAQGNTQGACSKLAQTRAEHPGLGTPEMKANWDALQRKLCLQKQ